MPEPIERILFDEDRLMSEHPPILRHRNKQAVFEVACPPGTVFDGQIVYSRWAAMALPETLDPAAARRLLVARPDAYDYAPVPDLEGAVEWHVNFADPNLFGYYGSGLFAQDEMQTAEHPALGALREALQAMGYSCRTVERGRPTPVLVAGVPRRCRIDTDPNPAEGRERGLYGNAFARADAEVVRRATQRLAPATVSNIIAIAALYGGHGRYVHAEVEYTLTTAYTGFRAAVLESKRLRGDVPVVVHTGFWGCGVFGGHRVMMTLLQVLAAGAAELDRLVFHTFKPSGLKVVDDTCATLDRLAGDGGPRNTAALIEEIIGLGFEWGVGDGN